MAGYRSPLGVDYTCRMPFFLCGLPPFPAHLPVRPRRLSPLLYLDHILIICSYLIRRSLHVICKRRPPGPLSVDHYYLHMFLLFTRTFSIMPSF